MVLPGISQVMIRRVFSVSSGERCRFGDRRQVGRVDVVVIFMELCSGGDGR